MDTAAEIIETMMEMRDDGQARHLMRFFKTGNGEYGEGDRFLGLKVPQTRMVVKEVSKDMPFSEIEKMLYCPWHEIRLAGFLLLVNAMKEATLPRKSRSSTSDAQRRDAVAAFYLKHVRQANNWDMVDLSCPKILGEWLLRPGADGRMPDRNVLDTLAASDNLWEQRTSIVSTLQLIRQRQYDDTLRIAAKLLEHTHDLIHKATGWMLREIGKKDKNTLVNFLETNHDKMPRTALRYAIEKMDHDERNYWLNRQTHA